METFLACRLDVQYKTIDYLYTPTYTRIGAYFIGVFAGWFLSRYDRKLDIEKVCTYSRSGSFVSLLSRKKLHIGIRTETRCS